MNCSAHNGIKLFTVLVTVTLYCNCLKVTKTTQPVKIGFNSQFVWNKMTLNMKIDNIEDCGRCLLLLLFDFVIILN